MKHHGSKQASGNPVFTLTRGISGLLLLHPVILRGVVTLALCLLVGAGIAALLWNVPIVTGIKGSEITLPLFLLGCGTLGMWLVAVFDSNG